MFTLDCPRYTPSTHSPHSRTTPLVRRVYKSVFASRFARFSTRHLFALGFVSFVPRLVTLRALPTNRTPHLSIHDSIDFPPHSTIRVSLAPHVSASHFGALGWTSNTYSCSSRGTPIAPLRATSPLTLHSTSLLASSLDLIRSRSYPFNNRRTTCEYTGRDR